MARILKRPMFSRGGTTKKNNGIMTGLVDRTELSVGSSPFTAERTSADVKAMMDAMNQYAPVTKQKLNLGEVGLNLAAGKYSGGDLLSTLAGAGSDLYKDFTTKDDAYRAAIDKRKQAAVSSSLSQQLAERKALAAAKQKDQFITLSDGQAKNELKGAYVPGVLYQKNLTTGKIEAKQLGSKQKDQFITLSDDQAKNELKGAYVENVLYQKNLTTGKIEAKQLGPKEIIKENVDEYKKEIDKSQGQKDVETISSAEKSFSEANKFSQTINVLNLLANSSDEELKTGTLGPLRLSATKLLNELGIDVDFQNVPLAELLNAVGGKVAVDALQGFKGAISNKELDFVVNRNPGLSTSKDGIKLQLELLSRANEISKKYYKEIISPFVTKNGGLRGTLDGKTFAQLQIEFYENNPYLTDDIRDKISSVENVIDPEYKKNIVVKDGISYFVDPKTGNVRQLPVIEE